MAKTLYYGVTDASTSGSASFAAVDVANAVTGTIAVANGGTGVASLTAYSPILAGTSSTGAFQQPASAGTAGQLFRSAGASAVATWTTATFPATAGTSGNVLTSDGTNWSSAAPAAGGMTWSVITADQNITVGNGYICNKAGLLTLTLPASPTAGNLFAVTGINTATGWKIAQNANQQIFIGTSSTTIGAGGSLASINIRDSVELVCVVGGASAVWNVISSVGNITVV